MSGPNLPAAKRQLMLMILESVASASDSQVDSYTHDIAVKTISTIDGFTDAALFDQICDFSLLDVSSFVRALCDLNKFYSRPLD